MALIRTENLTKTYRTGKIEVCALQGITLEIEQGEYVALMGPSGSGKSTLMHLLGCLDTPTAGKYWLAGTDVTTMDDLGLARLRNRQIGFVFQNFNLLPRLTARDNVQLPMVYAGIPFRERAERSRELLTMVGLAERMNHRSNELSGGEMQRVALARALANRPSLLLADEPTGNLDSRTGQEVMALLDDVARKGNTVILVTHDREVAAHARRILRMVDGKITS
ncbi:MAG: ABC transporter ATP-binding protein [candidate division WOR-3 bacterium]